jgi:hypothetical protein
MKNELATYQPNGTIQRFGDDQTMQWLLERGAEIFQVDSKLIAKFPDVRGALTKAMQLTLTYGAMPGKHVYLIPFNKKDGEAWRETYSVADSYEWRKASADRKAQEMRWQYMVQVETLTPDEIAKHAAGVGGPVTPNDCGAKARVLFAHEVRIAKEMGIDYNPPWHYGFWKQNAVERKGQWQADNVPSGRTRQWVANKRAEKSALAQHFELLPIADWNNRSDAQKRAMIEDHFTAVEPDVCIPQPMMAERVVETEVDGDVLFAKSDRRNASDAKFVVVEPETEPEAETEIVDFLATPNLPEPIYHFINDLRSYESPGARKASDKQYKFAVGIIEGVTGKNTHADVLRAIFGREVSAEAPMAEGAAKKLFAKLCTERSVKNADNSYGKEENPDYDAAYVEFVSWIGKHATGAQAGNK